nr:proline-rich protein 36-like [Aegilops tauschii subsp. strangulata]
MALPCCSLQRPSLLLCFAPSSASSAMALRRPSPGPVKPHHRLVALLDPDLAGFAHLLASSPVARELAVAPFPDLHHPASSSAITASSLCLLASFLPRRHWRPTPAPLPRELPHRRRHASPPPRRLEPPLPPRQPTPLLPRPPSASTEQAPAPPRLRLRRLLLLALSPTSSTPSPAACCCRSSPPPPPCVARQLPLADATLGPHRASSRRCRGLLHPPPAALPATSSSSPSRARALPPHGHVVRLPARCCCFVARLPSLATKTGGPFVLLRFGCAKILPNMYDYTC